eukprot:scaffold1352_cov129-Isochrysis_galbana.AAC.3
MPLACSLAATTPPSSEHAASISASLMMRTSLPDANAMTPPGPHPTRDERPRGSGPPTADALYDIGSTAQQQNPFVYE